MKVCRRHKGTLIPRSWNSEAGLGIELQNILAQRKVTPAFCEKCGYWVLTPTAKKSISLFGLRIQL